jgi:hypothetical protein
MQTKIYRLMGIDTAMHLLRPGAKWEISNNHFTRWEDERPCPTIEEVHQTIEKIKAFEESINTIYTKAQLEEMGIREAEIAKALGEIVMEQ